MGELDMFAGRHKEDDHSRTQLVDRNGLGDDRCTRLVGGAHASREDCVDPQVKNEDRSGYCRRDAKADGPCDQLQWQEEAPPAFCIPPGVFHRDSFDTQLSKLEHNCQRLLRSTGCHAECRALRERSPCSGQVSVPEEVGHARPLCARYCAGAKASSLPGDQSGAS